MAPKPGYWGRNTIVSDISENWVLTPNMLDFDQIRHRLESFYSTTGRPSIDPELMIRMLLVGYCYGIRSERRLCEEVYQGGLSRGADSID